MLYHIALIFLCSLGARAALDLPEASTLQNMYKSLPHSEFVEYFNSQNYSFKIAHYKHLSMHLACAKLDRSHRLPQITHDRALSDILPENFDARTKWPHCDTINDVYDQKGCGSCWTFGTACTASDRLCIHHNQTVRLAEQDFECCNIKDCFAGESVCEGGDPKIAFQYWLDTGLVTQECKPYDIEELNEGECIPTCRDQSKDYKKDKHRATEIYDIKADDESIRTELFKNGPIQAAFEVYEDFFNYRSGIYEHTYGNFSGYHSVRAIGYGVEGGIPYWLAVNSWGPQWGANGLFKYRRFQKAEKVRFEDYMCSGY